MVSSFKRMRFSFALCCLMICTFVSGKLQAQENPANRKISASKALLLQLQAGLQDSIAKAEKSVVSIVRIKHGATSQFDSNRFGRATIKKENIKYAPGLYGTGVIIDKAGYILTNYHVVDDEFRKPMDDPATIGEQQGDIRVTLVNQESYLAEIVAADPRSDLAVLKIQPRTGVLQLPAIKFADIKDSTKDIKKGQIVISLGNPYAIAKDGSVSASWGIISNVGRKLGKQVDYLEELQGNTIYHYGSVIQTDAKLTLGTSGGPLINLDGEMIGLTSSLAATTGYEQAAGFALPVDEQFRRIVTTLRLGKEVEYGYLGVSFNRLSDYERVGGRQGIVIDSVDQGQPAAMARLSDGDIINSINGRMMYSEESLFSELGKFPVGEKIRMEIISARRKPRTVEVTLSKFPVIGKKIFQKDTRYKARGIEVDYVSLYRRSTNFYLNEVVNKMQINAQLPLVVVDVDPLSKAEAAGIKRRTLISSVNGVPVRTPEEFRQAVLKAGKTVTLGLPSEERQKVTLK